jgi:hypothetical protein
VFNSRQLTAQYWQCLAEAAASSKQAAAATAAESTIGSSSSNSCSEAVLNLHKILEAAAATVAVKQCKSGVQQQQARRGRSDWQ